MSNSSDGGCATIFVIGGKIAAWLGSGSLAWNWVDPSSFGSAVLFLILWGILGAIFDFVLLAALIGLTESFD